MLCVLFLYFHYLIYTIQSKYSMLSFQNSRIECYIVLDSTDIIMFYLIFPYRHFITNIQRKLKKKRLIWLGRACFSFNLRALKKKERALLMFYCLFLCFLLFFNLALWCLFTMFYFLLLLILDSLLGIEHIFT